MQKIKKKRGGDLRARLKEKKRQIQKEENQLKSGNKEKKIGMIKRGEFVYY